MAQRKTAKLTRRLLGVLLLALILYACVSLASVRREVAGAQDRLEELEASARALEEANDQLRYDIDHAGDEEVIADIAREKLGLVLPGEKVYYDVGN